ncbi:MAG: AAA family ATPase [Bacilli bacterium]|nr:AAA family ATPase [Bacilli bacterium]
MARKEKQNANPKDIALSLPNYLDEVEVIKSNIFILDHILKGGIELGSSIQFIAESGVGKSTLALQLAKNLCKDKRKVVFVDTEASITKEILDSTGVNEYVNDSFFYIRESTYDNVEKYLDMYINTGEISLVIIDSLAGLINKCFTDLNKGVSVTTNATLYNSRPLTIFMNKYKSLAASKKFGLILINHYRNRVDTMKGTVIKEYGSKNVKYCSDVILKLTPIKSTSINKDFKDMTNSLTEATALEIEVIKSNKTYPNTTFPLCLFYGRGISNLCNHLYALMKLEILKKKVSFYELEYEGIIIKEQGIKNLYDALVSVGFDIERCHLKKVIDYYNQLNSKEKELDI